MAAVSGGTQGNGSMFELMRYGVNRKTHAEGNCPVLGDVKLQGMVESTSVGGDESTLTSTDSSAFFKRKAFKGGLKVSALEAVQVGASAVSSTGSTETSAWRHRYVKHAVIRVQTPRAHPAFLKAVQDPAQWPRVVEVYGTDYIEQGSLGGELFYEASSETASRSRRTQVILGGGVPSGPVLPSIELTRDRGKDMQASSSSNVLCFQGGDVKLLQPGLVGFEEWANSTKDSPAIVRGKLVSIAELLEPGPLKSKFKEFLRRYLEEGTQSQVPQLTEAALLVAQTDGQPEGTLREAPVLMEDGADKPVRWVGVQFRMTNTQRASPVEILDLRFGRGATAAEMFPTVGNSTERAEQELWEVPPGDHVKQMRLHIGINGRQRWLAGVELRTRCNVTKLFGVRRTEFSVWVVQPSEAIVDVGIWQPGVWNRVLTGDQSVLRVKLVIRNQYKDDEPLGIGAEILHFTAKLSLADGFFGREWLQKACAERLAAAKGGRGVELTGAPGSGKTAVLGKFVRDSAAGTPWKDVHLLAYHMCDGADGKTLQAGPMVCNVVRQAVKQLGGKVAPETCAEVLAGASLSACEENPQEAFWVALDRLLNEAGQPGGGVYVLVVDGLDESWSEDGLRILEVLKAAGKLPAFCRILLSVRKGHPACRRLDGLQEMGITGDANVKDILGYVKSRLSASSLLTKDRETLTGPKLSQVAKQVTDDSQGIIAYARCKLDDAISPRDGVIDLRKLGRGGASPGLSGLFNVYLQRKEPHSPLAAALLSAAVASTEPLGRLELLSLTVAFSTADSVIDKAAVDRAQEEVEGFLSRWGPLYGQARGDSYDFFSDSFRLVLEEGGLILLCQATKQGGHAWLAEAALLRAKLAYCMEDVQAIGKSALLLQHFARDVHAAGEAGIWPSKVFDALVERIGDPDYTRPGIQAEVTDLFERRKLLDEAFHKAGLLELSPHLDSIFTAKVQAATTNLGHSSLPPARVFVNAADLRARLTDLQISIPEVKQLGERALKAHLTLCFREVEGLSEAFDCSDALPPKSIEETELKAFFKLVAASNDFDSAPARLRSVGIGARKFLKTTYEDANRQLADGGSMRRLFPGPSDFARLVELAWNDVANIFRRSRLSGA